MPKFIFYRLVQTDALFMGSKIGKNWEASTNSVLPFSIPEGTSCSLKTYFLDQLGVNSPAGVKPKTCHPQIWTFYWTIQKMVKRSTNLILPTAPITDFQIKMSFLKPKFYFGSKNKKPANRVTYRLCGKFVIKRMCVLLCSGFPFMACQ